MGKLLVLNYHRITTAADVIDPAYLHFTLSETVFEAHLQLLYDLKIPVINLSETQNMPVSGLCVAITFDDGHQSDVEIALPILKKFHFSATFFPVVHHINKEGYVSWEELQLLKMEGHTIGSHGLTHQRLSKLTSDEVRNELLLSKEILEKEIGSPVRLFSFPYGDFTPAISELAIETGYANYVSTEFGFNQFPGNSVVLKRWNVKRATSTRELKLVIEEHFLTLARHRLMAQLKSCFLRIQRNLTLF
ncbi:MAG: polysaccharide deacetylase family protein [Bacteroidota bacterium]